MAGVQSSGASQPNIPDSIQGGSKGTGSASPLSNDIQPQISGDMGSHKYSDMFAGSNIGTSTGASPMTTYTPPSIPLVDMTPKVTAPLAQPNPLIPHGR